MRRSILFPGILAMIVILGVSLGVGLSVGLNHGHKETSNHLSDIGSRPHNSSTADKSTGYWRPYNNYTWDYHLNNEVSSIRTSVEVYDIDLFENSASIIQKLHDEHKKVICYFSAGSYENWRSDVKNFKDSDLGNLLDGWEGERWVDINSKNVRNIMRARIKVAYEKGCDAIDPDNVDAYDNENGLGLTEADSTSFVKFLAEQAHRYNMSVGLKNAGNIVSSVIDHVDFSVQEQCTQYEDCDDFKYFIENEKSVFHIEYPKGEVNNDNTINDTAFHQVCNDESSRGFSNIMKNMNLDDWLVVC